MDSIDIGATFFGWCAVINLAILVVGVVVLRSRARAEAHRVTFQPSGRGARRAVL